MTVFADWSTTFRPLRRVASCTRPPLRRQWRRTPHAHTELHHASGLRQRRVLRRPARCRRRIARPPAARPHCALVAVRRRSCRRAAGRVRGLPRAGPASAPSASARRSPPIAPSSFRLLSDRLLGYAWPKWCRGGDRVAVPRPCRRAVQARPVALRPATRNSSATSAGTTTTARAPACRPCPTATSSETGVRWDNGHGVHRQVDRRPGAQRPVLLPCARANRARSSPSRWSWRRASRQAPRRRARLDQHLERLQRVRRPQQLHHGRPDDRRRRSSTQRRTCRATS